MADLRSFYGDDIYRAFRGEQVALRSTELGRGGVVRVELDEQNQKIQYRMMVSGTLYDDVEDAFLEASKLKITQLDRITASSGRVGQVDTNPRRAQLSAILGTMQDMYDQRITSSQSFADYVSRITGEADISALRLSGTMASTTAASGKEAEEFLKSAKVALKGYVPIVGDEGIDIFQLQLGKTKLSSAQMHMLMAYLENGIINPSRYSKIFGQDITESEKTLSKIPKRARAFTSERDIAFQLQDIVEAMKGVGKHGVPIPGMRLEDTVVVVQEGSDVLRQQLFGSAGFDSTLFHRGKIMRGVDTQGIVDAAIRRATTGVTDQLDLDARSKKLRDFLARDDFKEAVKRSRDNKTLEKAVQQIVTKGSDEYKFFEDIMKISEQAFDGYAVLNKKVYNYGKNQLRQSIENIQAEIRSGNLSGEPLRAKQEQLSMLKEQYNKLKNADNLYQVTARGQMGPDEIKAAFDIMDLEGDMSNVAMVITQAGLKNDIQIGNRTNQIILSGLGSPKELVYADPVSLAFHPEIFASPEDVENYARYASEINQEFRAAIENNVLPQKVITALEKTTEQEFSDLEPARRLSKEKYRELARQTIELHQSGIGPQESPLMMNMLHAHYTTQMYKVSTKGGKETIMPALPNVQRFAIASEATEALSGRLNVNEPVGIGQNLSPTRSLLSQHIGSTTGRTGFQDVQFKNAQGNQVTAELAKFRVSNHKLLFAAEAIAENFYGLGGFDLDDKGLPKLFKSNIGDSLFFSITRQPSGIQEVLFTSAKLDDAETLKNLFGKEEFINSLNFLIDSENISSFHIYNPDTAAQLRDILTGRQSTLRNLDENEVMKVISEVYKLREKQGKYGITQVSDQLAEQIIKYGSSPLYNTNIFSRGNLANVEAVDFGALSDAQKEAQRTNRIFISQQMKKILPEYKDVLDQQLYQKLEQAMTPLANDTSESIMQKLNAIIEPLGNNVPAGLRAMIDQSIVGLMEESATKGKDILGVYVNRSMVIGSSLNQIDEFLKSASDEERRLLSKYKIAIAGQEFAIDKAVNFSEQQKFIAKTAFHVQTLLSQGADDLDQGTTAGLEYLRKLSGGTVTTLDEMMQEAMAMLGRTMGAQAAIYMGREAAGQIALDKDLFPIINTLFAETRMTTEADYQNLISGMISGIKDVKNNLKYDDQKINELLERLNAASTSSARAKELLEDVFYADADNRFAQVNNLMRATEEARATADTIRRLGIVGMPVDQALAATEMRDELGRVADFILDTNKKEMDNLFGKELKNLSNEETMNLIRKQAAMHDAVVEQIRTAAETAGATEEEIINAMEKRASQRRISFMNYTKLYNIGDEPTIGLQEKIRTVRSRRIRDFYRKTIEVGQMQKIEEANRVIDMLRQSQLDSIQQLTPEELMSFDPAILEIVSEYESENSEINKIINNINAQQNEEKKVIDELTSTRVTQAQSPENMKTFKEGVESALSGDNYSRYLPGNTLYKKFTNFVKDGELKNLFTENATFRRSVYATGALIAGSFIYSAFKDHTPEQIQGPPLLPGGSAYEEQYPNRLAEIPAVGTVNYNPGVSYKVNLYGQRSDVESFRSMAMELGNFNMNTTMYSGIPEVGRDPYAEMASSF